MRYIHESADVRTIRVVSPQETLDVYSDLIIVPVLFRVACLEELPIEYQHKVMPEMGD